MTRVLVTCRHLQRHLASFEAELLANDVEAVTPAFEGQQMSSAELLDYIDGVAAIIAGDDAIDRRVLERGKADRLRAVIKWGIGTDAIDLDAARALGIPVYNTPGAFGAEVADMAMSHVLLLSRRLHRMHEAVARGEWLQIEGRSLAGATAGIIGLGSIGREIARRCRAFGMEVIGHDIAPPAPDVVAEIGLALSSFAAVVANSDYLILACDLNDESRHMIGAEAIARMRPGSYLVNVARGPLVDEAALAEALSSGHLAGAGLDVYEDEPLPATSPLLQLDNVIFGAHSGSNTAEAVARVNRRVVDILWHVLGIAPIEPGRLNRVA